MDKQDHGKGNLIVYSKNNNKNFVLISADEYRNFHPIASKISSNYTLLFNKLTESDVVEWTNFIIEKCISQKYSFIFEGTLRTNRICKRLRQLRGNGYKIEIKIMVTNPLESSLSIHERYRSQIKSASSGRLTSLELHDDCCEGIEKTLKEIKDNNLFDSIEVYTRGESLLIPNLQYSSLNINNEYKSAEEAIKTLRKNTLKQTISSFSSRCKELIEDMEQYGYAPEEREQLDKILEMYNKMK